MVYQSPKGFWGQLGTPIICLAPMADVTDVAFRQMFAMYGKPHITWTEFVSADGLFLRPIVEGVGDQPKNECEEIALRHGVGTDHPLLKDLLFTDKERPIVAQFFSRDVQRMQRAAALAKDLGFDGVDINMGCPADIICKQGAGSAMIKDPDLAQEIIQATIEGAGGLPVSVKTRIGFNENEIETWLPALLAAGPVAVILHARTRKQMSKVPADWTIIERAVQIRNTHSSETLILGNGDVDSLAQAHEKVAQTGCDGVMIGRGIFGNPWLFNEKVKKEDLSDRDIMNALVEHITLFDHYLGDTKNFATMRKHFKSYLSGIKGGKDLWTRMMDRDMGPEETLKVLQREIANR